LARAPAWPRVLRHVAVQVDDRHPRVQRRRPYPGLDRGRSDRESTLPWRFLVHWIWFIIVGAIVGALGRLLHRGRDPMGWLLTIAIGVVSMIIAAAISSGWIAFVIGVVVAVVLVALVGRMRGDHALPAH